MQRVVAGAEVTGERWDSAGRCHPQCGKGAPAGTAAEEGVPTEVPDEAVALGGAGAASRLVRLEDERRRPAPGGGGGGGQSGEAGADDGDVGVGVHTKSTSRGAGV